MKRLGLILCLLGVPGFAADSFDGTFIIEHCQQGNAGACEGYIAGVADTFVVLAFDTYCVPESVTYGQIVRVVVKYVKDHPADEHEIAPLLIQQAMIDAFPCE